jgi:pimeloyl-ACP methyl ester carboxylesterase
VGLPGKRIEVGGLSFHVVDEGEGPAVLLLHGFPDSSYLWRNQIPALVEAGFRVIAPDLRGFGESDKPREVEAYGLQNSVSDVTAILDALEVERTSVVAHDWGAPIGWLLATLFPQRIERLAALSVGHFSTFTNVENIEQRERSWYMLFFQFEGVAEEHLTRNDWELFRALFRNHSELATWIPDLERPGALTAALSWYRANVNPRNSVTDAPALPPVQVPVLGIWSTGDAYLTEQQMVESAPAVAGPWRYERIEDASHWMQLDQPDRLNRLLIGFLKEG